MVSLAGPGCMILVEFDFCTSFMDPVWVSSITFDAILVILDWFIAHVTEVIIWCGGGRGSL